MACNMTEHVLHQDLQEYIQQFTSVKKKKTKTNIFWIKLFNEEIRKKIMLKYLFFHFECTVFNLISLNVHENEHFVHEMKPLPGFQVKIFNYPDYSLLYWILEEHFFKQLHFNCTGMLEIVSKSKENISQ